MASVPKSTFNSFIEDWNGRKAWAQSAGIPYNDFAQTVKYDYNRMTNSQGYGEKMSDTEAFDAMTALKNGQNPFSTPSDATPSILNNPAGAVRNDLQGIFTGLFHAPQQIFHDFDSAIHGHFGGVASLVPLYTDITDLFSSQGRDYLLEHPISDMLDAMGTSKILDVGAHAIDTAGADGAATDLVNRLPDHPVTKLMKSTFNDAAQKYTSIAAIQEYGTDILGSFGQLQDQKDYILRPFRAAATLIKQTPFADYFTKLGPKNLAFGKVPEGEALYKVIDSTMEGMTRPDINRAVNMFNYSADDDANIVSQTPFEANQVKDPRQWLSNPAVPDSSKVLYRAFQKASTSLRMAEWIDQRELKPVYHPVTGKLGWTKRDGAWDKYITRMNKVLDRKRKDGSTLGEALRTVYTSLKHLKDDDAGLPAPLKSSPDEVVNLPNSLRRVASYYTINARNLFTTVDNGVGFGRKLKDFNRSIDRNFGPESKIQSIITEIGSLRNARDAGEIIRQTKSIKLALRKLSIPQDSVFHWLNNTLDDVQRTVYSMGVNQRDIGNLRDAYAVSERDAARVRKSLDLNWNRYTQQSYSAMVQREIRAQISKYITDHYQSGEIHAPKRLAEKGIEVTPQMAEHAQAEVLQGNYSDPSVTMLFGPGEYNKITSSAWLLVSDMQAAGAKPIFVTGVNRAEEEAIANGRYGAITDISKYAHRSIEYERKPVLTSTIFNPVFGIAKESIGIYRQSIIKELLNNFIPNLTISRSDMIREARNYGRIATDTPTLDEVRAYAKAHNYVEFNPTQFTAPKFEQHMANPEATWIKSYNLDLMRKTFDEMDRSISGAYNTLMQAYRFSVLQLSPRYAAHITLGGGLMTALRLINPIMAPIRYMREAWSQAADLHTQGVLYSRGVSEQGVRGELAASPFKSFMENPRQALEEAPIATHNFLVGRKLAEMYHAARSSRLGVTAASTMESYKELLEHVSNFQRALASIEGEHYAIDHPEVLTPDNIKQAALWHTTPAKYYGATLARKVLADMQVVSPFERTFIMRYVIPFWGWTRHILRYIATYPADHPLRASILQSITNQAVGTESQLPDYLFRLLFLGQPNAQGTVDVLDDRQWNPFRDAANYMTWGGIMSTLNPVLQAITASAWGVNSSTGSVGLYPQLSFDAFYGSDAAQPGSGNVLVNLVKQISPQIDTLTETMSSTSSLREQAKANPGDLGYLIADSIGFPWIPHPINEKQIAIKGTTDEASLAAAAVQQALVENSMAPLSGYSGLLPYSGFNVDKNFVKELINQALAYNKETGLDIPAQDLIALPYASPYFPETLQGPTSEGQGSP